MLSVMNREVEIYVCVCVCVWIMQGYMQPMTYTLVNTNPNIYVYAREGLQWSWIHCEYVYMINLEI